HDHRELAALLRQVGYQLGEVLRLGQDQILDVDARQLAELGNQRQQRFGKGVLVEADRERLAFGLPPVDLGLAKIGNRFVVLRRRSRGSSRRERRRQEKSREPPTSQAHVVLPLTLGEFCGGGLYPVKQNRIPQSGIRFRVSLRSAGRGALRSWRDRTPDLS